MLRNRADPDDSSTDEEGGGGQPLTAAAVSQEARRLLEDADLLHLQDDELLQNRCGTVSTADPLGLALFGCALLELMTCPALVTVQD